MGRRNECRNRSQGSFLERTWPERRVGKVENFLPARFELRQLKWSSCYRASSRFAPANQAAEVAKIEAVARDVAGRLVAWIAGHRLSLGRSIGRLAFQNSEAAKWLGRRSLASRSEPPPQQVDSGV
jgi:hypothetical protein